MISATQKLIDEQNALVSKKKEAPMGREVLILKEGKYGDVGGKAAIYKVGDVLTTTDAMARVHVAAGSVSFDVPPAVAPAPVEEDPVEEGPTPFTAVKGVTKKVNAGLLAAGATWEKIREESVSGLTKVPGLGAKTAALLKAQAEVEVELDA